MIEGINRKVPSRIEWGSLDDKQSPPLDIGETASTAKDQLSGLMGDLKTVASAAEGASVRLSIREVDVETAIGISTKHKKWEPKEIEQSQLMVKKTSIEPAVVSDSLKRLGGKASFVLTRDKNGQNSLYLLRMNRGTESCHSFLLVCIELDIKELEIGNFDSVENIHLREIQKQLSRYENELQIMGGDMSRESELQIKEKTVLAGGEIYFEDGKITVSNKCGTIYGEQPDRQLDKLLVGPLAANFKPYKPENSDKEQAETLDLEILIAKVAIELRKIEALISSIFSNMKQLYGEDMGKRMEAVFNEQLQIDIKEVESPKKIDGVSLKGIVHRYVGNLSTIF